MAERVDNLNLSPFSRHVRLPNYYQSSLEVGNATQENTRDESINNHPTNKNHSLMLEPTKKQPPTIWNTIVFWTASPNVLSTKTGKNLWCLLANLSNPPQKHEEKIAISTAKNLQPHFNKKKQNHSCVLNGKSHQPSTKEPLKTLPLKTFHGSHPTSHHLIPFRNSQRSHPIPATPQRPYVARSWSSQRVATSGGRGIHWEHLVITSNRGYLQKGWLNIVFHPTPGI